MIPYGHQDISPADIEAVAAVLRSDWLTQGPAVEHFERVVADFCGAPYASAVSSATAALHLAYRAVGLGPGDLLWTSPNTFVATANAALMCGARVDFVDIDPETLNLCTKQLAAKLQVASRSGRLPKVVVPVHFSGRPCEMRVISDLADQYGFRVVEDASHAIGAYCHNHRVGDGAFSDVTVFSFHPVKIVTTGEGGMLVTRNRELWERAQLWRSHGITRDPAKMRTVSEGAWYYEQLELGYNYRMTDIQAALGISQMERVELFIQRRHLLAWQYDRAFADLPIDIPRRPVEHRSALHLYPILLREDGKSRAEVFDELRQAGIGVNVHYIPVHLQPFYRALGFSVGDFPEAERYYARAISLPMYYGLSHALQQRVIDAVRAVFL